MELTQTQWEQKQDVKCVWGGGLYFQIKTGINMYNTHNILDKTRVESVDRRRKR